MRNGETDFFTIGDKFQICIFSPTYMHLERERERVDLKYYWMGLKLIDERRKYETARIERWELYAIEDWLFNEGQLTANP